MQCLIWNQLQCAVHQQVLVNPSERVNDPIPPLYVRMAAIEGLADHSCKSLWQGFERAVVYSG